MSKDLPRRIKFLAHYSVCSWHEASTQPMFAAIITFTATTVIIIIIILIVITLLAEIWI